MAADDASKPGKKPPTVQPVVPPTVMPVVPPKGVPVVRPVVPPTVPPVVQPVSPPVLKPVVVPVVQPVAAPGAAPVPIPAAAPAAPSAGDHHRRAADRVVSFTGMSTGLQVAMLTVLLSGLAAFFAWYFSRSAGAGARDVVDESGTAAARLFAVGDFDWWQPKHGTAEEMRDRVREVIAEEEMALRLLPDGEAKEAMKAKIEAARTVFTPGFLNDRKEDEIRRTRNLERMRSLDFSGTLVGADLFDTSRRPTGIGKGVPVVAMEQSGELLVGGPVRLTDRGDVRVRVYLAPIRGGKMSDTGEFPVVGFAAVALSAESAYGMMEAAGRNAALAGGAVLALGLLGVVFSLVILAPLRRVLKDAEEFSRGNFDHHATPSGGGEVGAIGRAVARMALAAKDRENEALSRAAAAAPAAVDHRATVSAALAPGALLKVPAWEIEGTSRACVDLAGDFFDYSMAARGRVAAILVETSLRGLPAAFAAAQVQAHFRALAPAADSASLLLDSLGAAAGPRLPEDAEIHATVLVADPETGGVEIARAGKVNPPALWRAATKSVEKVEVDGPPVRRLNGPGTGASAGHVEIVLQPRDRLCLVSDGLFRARNSKKEKFGDQRLDGLVLKFGPMNSTAFVNMVVNEVDLFHEGAMQRDDLTILTVRRMK